MSLHIVWQHANESILNKDQNVMIVGVKDLLKLFKIYFGKLTKSELNFKKTNNKGNSRLGFWNIFIIYSEDSLI